MSAPALAVPKLARDKSRPIAATGYRLDMAKTQRGRRRMQIERKFVQDIREALVDLKADSPEKVQLIQQIDGLMEKLRIQIGVDRFLIEHRQECGAEPTWAVLQEALEWAAR